MNVKAFAESILDLVYPPALYCICCGNLIDETRTYHLCDHCIRHIRWDDGPPAYLDGESIEMMRVAQYGIYERTLIFSLKYNGHKYIAREIGEMMRDRLAFAGRSFDIIVPVPLSQAKEQSRGFNQSALIAKHLGNLTGTEVAPKALIRTRDTRPMRGLSPKEREDNIRGSIQLAPEAAPKLQGKHILLLDDFYTTGATARECQRAMAAASPAGITFLAFAAK